MAAAAGGVATPLASLERGAESTGEIRGGGSWRVHHINDGGSVVHIVVATLAPGVRRKARIPKKHATADTRARYAAAAADELRKQYLADLAEKAKIGATPTPKTKLTFKEVGTMWTSGDLARDYPDHVSVKSTAHNDVSRLRELYETIGDLPIEDFVIEDAERAMSKLPARVRTPATRRHYSQVIRRVLQLSVYPLKLIDTNPIPKNFMPKVGKGHAVQWIYPDEEKQLVTCTAVPLQRRLLWGVLSREGARDGEIVALVWKEIDLVRGVLTLDKNKTRVPRAWALDPAVTRALRLWKKQHPNPKPDARVFVDELGASFDGSRFADLFRTDLKIARVTRTELFEKSAVRAPIRAHDCRATFVTVKLALGWTEAQITARTGHESSTMLARYRRTARTATDLSLGDFCALDVALFGEQPEGGDGRDGDAERVPEPAAVPDVDRGRVFRGSKIRKYGFRRVDSNHRKRNQNPLSCH